MIGLAIAAVVGSPILVLVVGFLGVSQKRAEDSRAHLSSTTPTPEKPVEQTQTAAEPTTTAQPTAA